MKPEFLQARYYTFISTCSMLGISAQKYFRVFRAFRVTSSSDDNRRKIDN